VFLENDTASVLVESMRIQKEKKVRKVPTVQLSFLPASSYHTARDTQIWRFQYYCGNILFRKLHQGWSIFYFPSFRDKAKKLS
jgi:hypothetical protein